MGEVGRLCRPACRIRSSQALLVTVGGDSREDVDASAPSRDGRDGCGGWRTSTRTDRRWCVGDSLQARTFRKPGSRRNERGRATPRLFTSV
jgi:hypothetical protein